jgi:hypothetical protein
MKERNANMELDNMKSMWEACDRKLDANLRLTTRLLNAPLMRKAKTSLTRLTRIWQIEFALVLAVVVCLGRFEAMHITEPRFLIPAVMLHVGTVVLLVTYGRRIAALRRIDFSGPIISIQKQLESIRVAEIRATKWTILLSPIAWTPFLIVAFEGFFHVDAYATFNRPWLAGNVLFGVVLILVERWVSFRYAERMQGSPRLQRWMRDVSGYNMAAATRFLHAAAEFEKESA